jgi:purine-binding chemotaxis protein CheW
MTSNGGQAGTIALLICRVGTRLCGIPLEHVVETMRPLPVEPLSHLPAFVDGLALIRGTPTPVLDAQRLLGADVEAQARQRYVTIRWGARSAALAVDAVVGVRHVDASQLAELPALLREPRNELVSCLGTLDRELLVILERSRLLPDSVWDTLDAEAGVQ